MATHAMKPVDAAWYHIDSDANPAIVTGVVLTSRRLDWGRVRAVLERRLARIDRYRQRVVETGLPLPTPHWEDMPDFDLDAHLHHVALPRPGGRPELAALLDELASAPLPRDRPLWQAHLVDGVGRGSALVLRYHHCIGDGLAMMHVASRLFDTRRDAAPGFDAADLGIEQAPRGALVSAFESVEGAAREALGVAGAAWDAVVHPQRALAQAAEVLRGSGVLVEELLKAPDPASPLKGRFGARQRVAWSAPVAIDELKAIGAPFAAKANDVIVAAVAGALRTYLQRRGIDVDRTTVRAMVPVNLRPPERAGDLGNEFGLVILELPVMHSGPMQRLIAAKARMDVLKRSPEAVAMRVLFDVFGRGPKALEDAAQGVFGSKASVVLTNVAGPRTRLYLAGVPIERMMFCVPHPGDQLGMGISVLSYRKAASLAVMADARLVPDPWAITEAFEREVAQMRTQWQAAAAQVAAQHGANA